MVQNAIVWRLNYARQLLWKLKWKLRRLTDFSPKENTGRISLVVVGRNDNYGGDFSSRLQATLDWNMSQLPDAELIYVEWNPLADKPSDTEWITNRYPSAKCYIVPPEIHRMHSANPEKLPVMEYFGKNLGIRKSTSHWILVINADVLIAPDTLKRMNRLNRNTIYGTHYISFHWDQKPITPAHFKAKEQVTVAFAVPDNIYSVAGNFILTHRQNWMQATGYDERLTGSRAGVDSNGAAQLVYHGCRQQVLGHHYHLDHPESIVHTSHESHGDTTGIRNESNIPYKNDSGWGLENYPLIQKAERVWELQKI